MDTEGRWYGDKGEVDRGSGLKGSVYSLDQIHLNIGLGPIQVIVSWTKMVYSWTRYQMDHILPVCLYRISTNISTRYVT